MNGEDPRLTREDIKRLRAIEQQRLAQVSKKVNQESKKEKKQREDFYRKERKKLEKQEKKIAKRSRLAEKREIRKRSSFLTKAIIIIGLLLALLLACAIFF
ncbi:MAG: cell wall synthase accessory phosphoprotein MacP [Streptococcaceae bacterium]|jgi:rubrerythrin|nr:cell wall synthase accessory phosphoprotein MacP [Streptococcaceae bacterium]